jgi:hypothetical protein
MCETLCDLPVLVPIRFHALCAGTPSAFTQGDDGIAQHGLAIRGLPHRRRNSPCGPNAGHGLRSTSLPVQTVFVVAQLNRIAITAVRISA